MNARHILIATTLAASVAAAFAPAAWADDGHALSRAEVRAQVLEAAAKGQLIPPGQAAEPIAQASAGPSRSRDEVRTEVLYAAAHGGLVPAGQGLAPNTWTVESTVARADVREAVRVAQLRGELIPPGQGFAPGATGTTWHGMGTMFASMRKR